MSTKSSQILATPETRKDVAEWLGITQSTLRSWDSRFSELLESQPGKKGSAVKKRYTENDLIVFLAIKSLRNNNQTFDQIEAGLDAEITRTYLPEWGASMSRDIIPAASELVSQNRQLTNQIIETESKLAAGLARAMAIEEERDRLLEQLDKTQERLLEAEIRASKAETLLEIKTTQEEAPGVAWWAFWRK